MVKSAVCPDRYGKRGADLSPLGSVRHLLRSIVAYPVWVVRDKGERSGREGWVSMPNW